MAEVAGAPGVVEGAVGLEEEEQEEVEEEEEEELEEEQVFVIPNLMNRTDPLRMVLTTEEEEWAMSIKIGVESTPELDNLSDFMYAHYALVCKGNTADALERAQNMQHFREEYGIMEECGQGCTATRQFFQLMPGAFLHFGFSYSEGTYVLAQDPANFDSSLIVKHSEERLRLFFAFCYYMAHTAFPDFESMRKGMICMFECHGMDWGHKQAFNLFLKVFSELWSSYPLNGKFHHYHTGVVFNVMGAAFKRQLPAELKDKFHYGMTCEGRLDSICLVPTVEAAMERVACQMEHALHRRYENEKLFSLSS